MANKKSHEQFVQDILKDYNLTEDKVTFLTNYNGWDQKITFRCNVCGQVKTVCASSLKKKPSSHRKNICACYNYSEEWHKYNTFLQNWVNTQEQYNIINLFLSKNKVELECKYCNSKQVRTAEFLYKDDRCLNCQKKVQIKKSEESFIKELFQIYGEEYSLVGDYSSVNEYCLIKHNTCGKIYKAKPHYLLTEKGGTCPICNTISKGERKIKNFLDLNNIIYRQQERLESFKKAPYDFYLPDYNLLIEFQGIQHFQPVPHFGGEESYNRQIEIDAKKKKVAQFHQKDLLIITYEQIDEIDQILAQRLSLTGVGLNPKQ